MDSLRELGKSSSLCTLSIDFVWQLWSEGLLQLFGPLPHPMASGVKFAPSGLVCSTVPISHTQNLRAALLSMRSLAKHYLDIFSLLKQNVLDILILTETWLDKDSAPDIAASLPLFSRLHVPGEER